MRLELREGAHGETRSRLIETGKEKEVGFKDVLRGKKAEEELQQVGIQRQQKGGEKKSSRDYTVSSSNKRPGR